MAEKKPTSLTFYILFQKKLNRYVFKVSYTIDLVENKRVIRPKFNRACCIQASFMLTLKNKLNDPNIWDFLQPFPKKIQMIVIADWFI